jgi:dihydrofolate reductase
MVPDEDMHRHAAETLAQADALIFGRVTYEMMEAAWRPLGTGKRPDWMAEWMEPFARTIDAAKKYVVSSNLKGVDWNAELVRGDHLEEAVQQLKRQPGKGLLVGGVKLPLALANLGLIDEYQFIEAGRPRANVVRRTIQAHQLEVREPAGVQLRRGGDAV